MSATQSTETVLSCAGCGATIYQEHLDRHLADHWAGSLYCAVCLAEKKGGGARPAPPQGEALETFTLEDAPAGAPAMPPPAPAPVAAPLQVQRRPPRAGAQGATRMRIFHAKLSEGAVAHMDQQINDWLDHHPEIEIKFANTTVGVWEGKHPEPNLIISVYY